MKKTVFAFVIALLGLFSVSCEKNPDGGTTDLGKTDWRKIEKMMVGAKWTFSEKEDGTIIHYYDFISATQYRYYVYSDFIYGNVPIVNGIVQAPEDSFDYMVTVNLSVREFITGKIFQVEGIEVSIINNDTIRIYSPRHDSKIDLLRIKGFSK